MLTVKQLYSAYPQLACFNDGFYQRRSSLGKVFLVRKNRWGDSPSRMFDRRLKIKRNLNTLINSRRVSSSADPSLLSLNLKNIGDRRKRKAYAAVVKQAAKGVRKVFR